VHRLSRRSSKLSSYPEKVHKEVMAVQLLTHVVDSSRCEEHIINPLQHRKEHIRAVKIEEHIPAHKVKFNQSIRLVLADQSVA
jgi:hypothetical protein